MGAEAHLMDVAHSTVKRALLKLATPANSVDYSDDFPAKEKKVTHPCREKNRAGALTLAHEGIVKLDRVGKNLRVRKQTVTDFRFGLKVHLYHDQQELEKAIYWSLEARRSFTEYLRNKQWTVRESPTEADLAIATDCKPDDIIISRDSDMLVYGTILTIWRPISRRQCLVYDVPSVLATLNISKIRLTVLGVVSKNDYNSNIYSLRCITNFGTIKLLERDGAPAMVKAYLAHSQVVIKNTEEETFDVSIQMFVNLVQTPVQSDVSPSLSLPLKCP